jgi:hypothetical protein
LFSFFNFKTLKYELSLSFAITTTGVSPGFLIIDDGWQQVAPDPQFRSEFPQSTVGPALHMAPSPAVTSVRPVEGERGELQCFEQR